MVKHAIETLLVILYGLLVCYSFELKGPQIFTVFLTVNLLWIQFSKK